MGDELGRLSVGIILYVGMLTYTRFSLKNELAHITHRRLFRHKSKQKIPFFRKFFLLNYIDQFKKKWMWHYVVFIAEAIVGIVAIVFHILRVIFEENGLVAGVHRVLVLLSIPIFMLPAFFPNSRWMRVLSEIMRK